MNKKPNSFSFRKYASRLIFFFFFTLALFVLYAYFTDFFSNKAFGVANKNGEYQLAKKGYAMLLSPIFWIPFLYAFGAGLTLSIVGQVIAKFAYDSDENNEIKRYKDWHARGVRENNYKLEEQIEISRKVRAKAELDVNNATKIAEASVQHEKNNLVKTREELELLITDNEAKQAELDQEINDYYSAKRSFEDAKETLDTQKAEFNAKRETENKAFHRATAKKERKNNALSKMEHQYNQSQQYIRALQAKITELESEITDYIS